MAQKVRWGVIGAGGIADRRTIPGMMLCALFFTPLQKYARLKNRHI